MRILKQTPSAPGVYLVLSLDMSPQRIASQVLSESNGAVVAIEPTTGVLVALVSRPAYDPDLFVDSATTLITANHAMIRIDHCSIACSRGGIRPALRSSRSWRWPGLNTA